MLHVHVMPVLWATTDSQVADDEDLSSRPVGRAVEGGNSCRDLGHPWPKKSEPVTSPFVELRAGS